MTIAAGSAVLTAPDGGLRETDAGKNIAVPGAADLAATIARLVDRKDVDSASMTAGQATLTASFTDPSERFRADLHTGHRIVVDGAGPAGQPLLTDVLADADVPSISGADGYTGASNDDMHPCRVQGGVLTAISIHVAVHYEKARRRIRGCGSCSPTRP